MTDREILAWYAATYTAAGWRIASQSDAGIQFVKPRRVSAVLIVLALALALLGCVLRFVWIGAAFVLFAALMDYLHSGAAEYLSAAQARERALRGWV